MKEKILEIIKEELKLENDVVLTDEMRPGDFPEWDSMGHMVMITALEKRLGIKFEYEDIMEMDSVGSIVKTITQKYDK